MEAELLATNRVGYHQRRDHTTRDEDWRATAGRSAVARLMKKIGGLLANFLGIAYVCPGRNRWR